MRFLPGRIASAEISIAKSLYKMPAIPLTRSAGTLISAWTLTSMTSSREGNVMLNVVFFKRSISLTKLMMRFSTQLANVSV